MNKTTLILLLASGISMTAFAFAFIFFSTPKNMEYSANDVTMMKAQESSVIAQPPVEVINTQTGEVDEVKFQSVQSVTKDTTLDSVEKELNETVILEEDFSNL